MGGEMSISSYDVMMMESETNSGKWVLREDVEALESRLKEAEDCIRKCNKSLNDIGLHNVYLDDYEIKYPKDETK
jgi:hypothetical protein